ncbi:unnamed protein product [Rhizoctonia solani]|uniref:WSC domain-containing protein n=1 Tax=Rhizoctonia solani TaxID=456999 RepID=A0A8H3CE16_9AGAM|nr:unnamed protein product [Rhizoctonia solani]
MFKFDFPPINVRRNPLAPGTITLLFKSKGILWGNWALDVSVILLILPFGLTMLCSERDSLTDYYYYPDNIKRHPSVCTVYPQYEKHAFSDISLEALRSMAQPLIHFLLLALFFHCSWTLAISAAPILPTGWSSTFKCIIDSSTSRVLSGRSFTSGSLTLDQCISTCDQGGFLYAGAEYGSECYCGNSISTANGGGAEVSASECSTNCTGNSQQKCGASYRMTLYSKTMAASPIPSGWNKSFCTIDQSTRVLGGYTYKDNSMTPGNCITACAQHNSTLAGVENGNECYCGNTVIRAYPTKDSDCRIACAGDGSQYCGGTSRLMVYIKVLAPTAPTGPDAWTLKAGGNSGVLSVMTHVAVATNDTMLVIDRKENNPLLKADGKPAWGAVWNLQSNTARPLNLTTHSFCSSGNFLSNGTLVNFGGHPFVYRNGELVSDGQQGVRLFNPCPASGNCDIYENPTRIRLTSNRWYPTSARLHDGSVVIIGGMTIADWTNSASVNNPSYEFFPPKNINGYNGLQIPSQFFKDTLPHNTYPHVYALPNKKLFVAANNQAMLLDWEKNVETRLPNFPNGQRVVYPMNAAGVLLPLTPGNNYTPEVLICGGSHISDTLRGEQINAQQDYASAQCSRMVLDSNGIAGGWKVEYMPEPRVLSDGVLLPNGKILIINGGRTGVADARQDYASAQCSRMVIDSAGIAAGWKVEYMPEPRILSDGVLLPNGKVLIINGGRTGAAGYANAQNRIGDSNADNPTFTPLLYDPALPVGQRFTQANMPTSNIGRLYHSVATLLPSGAILIGGSNPNDDMQTRPWASEYRVEYLNPPYMSATRPTYTGLPAMVNYGTTFSISVSIPASSNSVKVILMDLGFITHSVHMDQKAVELVSTLSADRRTLTIVGPPNAPIYSPGPGWIFVVVDDIPSVAQRLMIGTGASPPKDDAAIANMLAKTANPISGPHF